jgi:hypothetical protein
MLDQFQLEVHFSENLSRRRIKGSHSLPLHWTIFPSRIYITKIESPGLNIKNIMSELRACGLHPMNWKKVKDDISMLPINTPYQIGIELCTYPVIYSPKTPKPLTPFDTFD